ncbi:MAG: hypothetical protein Q8L66_01150 [Caulobacter sp.]|nr:hypothetical protein [Caulobacter sp.]
MPRGETLTILKYERSAADQAYDADGVLVAIPAQTDETVSLFAEHGLTDRLTVQGRLAWTRGGDPFVTWEGRGPVELGLRYAVVRRSDWVVSLYVGGTLAGEGRNAGYAAPGEGKADREVRLLAGRGLSLKGRPAFAEIQIADLDRSGLPDETRLDLTLGVAPAARWLVLVQTYSGSADGPSRSRWTKLEMSALRRTGRWRFQAGWRTAIAGRESPAEAGPVVAIWRRF